MAIVEPSDSPATGVLLGLLADEDPEWGTLSTTTGRAWHPKLTIYRILVITSTLGLAVAKSATSFLKLTSASITIEWILGVVFFLLLNLIGSYEEQRPPGPVMTWFFHVDHMAYVWAIFRYFTGSPTLSYLTEEHNVSMMLTLRHPPITGYRILVTVSVALFGFTKAALSYGKPDLEFKIVECVFGVWVVTGLYWVGLYESSSTKAFPKLFHIDYTAECIRVLANALTVVLILLHLIALFLASGFTYYSCYVVSSIYQAFSTSSSPRTYGLFLTSTCFMLTAVATVIPVSGTTCVALILGSLHKLSAPVWASRNGQWAMSLVGIPQLVSAYDGYMNHPHSPGARGRISRWMRAGLRNLHVLPHLVLFLDVALICLVCYVWLVCGTVVVIMETVFKWILLDVILILLVAPVVALAIVALILILFNSLPRLGEFLRAFGMT
ncbi:hypothetical protein B0H34DRAFT_811867 [Crassisporium funariophilum]|nr:hypothetical protein B0H34DRAFT_811867 [Crassisporium funariophilum]